LLRLIERFLGSHNVSSESLQRILERNFSSAQLYGKLANIDADLSSEALRNTGLLKKLTGGDKLTGEYKNKQLFEFVNRAKVLFSANKIPLSTDETDAFYRRIIIVNFTRQFFGDEEDPYLFEKITTDEELSGLLRVLVERLPRVLKEGIRQTTNEAISKTQDQYLMSADPTKFFVEKALNRDPNTNTPKSTVFESYLRFCRHFKLPVDSEQAFSRRLSKEYNFGYDQFRLKGEKVYCWIGVKVSDWLATEDKDQKTLEELRDDGGIPPSPGPDLT
jgi:putative DNA primase/helicase